MGTSLPANVVAMFRAYDIRGIVEESLTESVVYDIGRALGSEALLQQCQTMVVARDGRASSPILSNALIKGLLTTGVEVIDVGMVPTPVLYFAVHHSEGRSGVMITGSHNPANYNGLKMMIAGHTLAEEKIQVLKQRIEQQDFTSETEGQLQIDQRFEARYIEAITQDVTLPRSLKIVMDCGNGVAGELAPRLLKALGCEVIELFCEIDGNFPNHHPDPSKPENLQDLINAVKEHQADVGMAFDGDGDRLGIIDSEGNIIWPDRQMMLFSQGVLSKMPNAQIIYDVKCSKYLTSQILAQGGRPLMWKTGHSFMKAKLKETGAELAGEMSGHIFFNDRWFGFDDALYSAARMAEILASDCRTSSELFATLPDSINTPELNVTLEEGENFLFIEKMLEKANFEGGEMITIDGLRVDFSDGWGLVRASNTTPSLVIRFEADTQVAIERIQQQFKTLMLEIKADIVLPF